LKRSRLRPKIPVIELFLLISIYIYILEGLVRRLYLNYHNNRRVADLLIATSTEFTESKLHITRLCLKESTHIKYLGCKGKSRLDNYSKNN
jgi:hypothetical protein